MPNYKVSESQKMDRRRDLAREFFDAILEFDEHPYFVSDEACLYDVYAGEDEVVIERCLSAFGFRLTKKHFRMPVWQLLDIVFSNKSAEIEFKEDV